MNKNGFLGMVKPENNSGEPFHEDSEIKYSINTVDTQAGRHDSTNGKVNDDNAYLNFVLSGEFLKPEPQQLLNSDQNSFNEFNQPLPMPQQHHPPFTQHQHPMQPQVPQFMGHNQQPIGMQQQLQHFIQVQHQPIPEQQQFLSYSPPTDSFMELGIQQYLTQGLQEQQQMEQQLPPSQVTVEGQEVTHQPIQDSCCGHVMSASMQPVHDSFRDEMSTEQSQGILLPDQDFKFPSLELENICTCGKNGAIEVNEDEDTNLLSLIYRERSEKAMQYTNERKTSCCQHCFLKYINHLNRVPESAHLVAGKLKLKDVLAQLICSGANISLQNGDGDTIFHIIVKGCDNEEGILELLCLIFNSDQQKPTQSYKQALDKRNNNGKAVIHLANKRKHQEVLKLLTEQGAWINRKDAHDRRTCVVKSARDQDWTQVKFLVSELGACVNVAPDSNVRVIHYACMESNVKAVKYLIEKGVELNQKTSQKQTEKQLTNSKEIKDIISAEMLRRRKRKASLKGKEEKARKCICGKSNQIIHHNY